MAIRIDEQAGGVRLMLKVVPGAKCNRIVGELGDALKVAVSKPPEGGAANRAVVELIAGALGIAGREVEIVRGQASARKEIMIRGLSAAEVRSRLQRA